MPDLLRAGSDWLLDQLKTHASRTVTYERGVDSVDVPAVIGRTVFEIDDDHGAIERFESRDFLVQAADLVLAGIPATPERGDRVRETEGSVTYVYEVMAPAGQPHWKFSDAFRRTFRIHTKHVDTLGS